MRHKPFIREEYETWKYSELAVFSEECSSIANINLSMEFHRWVANYVFMHSSVHEREGNN